MRGPPILPECIQPNPCRTSSTSTSRISTKLIPTNATFDGVHLHDDLLEDFSRAAIDAQIRDARRVRPAAGRDRPARLTDIERLERPALDANIRARLFELEEVRTWERNPQLYADLLATSLAGQALFDYAPLAERARRVAVEAAAGAAPHAGGARQHQGSARHLRQGRPREPARHAALHRGRSAAGVRRPRRPAPARRPRRRVDRSVAPRSAATSTTSKTDLAPRAQGLVPSRARALRAEAAARRRASRSTPIACSRSRCASCTQTQEEFRRVASRLNGGDPAGRLGARQGRPSAGRRSSSPPRRQQLDELETFIRRQRSSRSRMPRRSSSRRRPVLSLDVRQHVDAGPVRDEAAPRLLLHHRRRSDVAAERQDEHLRDFNYGALWSISIHEVFPGHFLHYQHLRQVESKVRKSILFSSTAFVEGWAHYCEQMMIEAGFRRNDPAVKLGQLAEALIRLCRFVVGIRLHCEDLSVEQGVRFFRDEAFLEEATARREAERGTFDPSYIVLLARQADDAEAARGLQGRRRRRSSRCARSTTRCSRNGTRAALAAPRRLMLGRRSNRRRCSSSRMNTTDAAYTNTSATPAATASSGSRSSRIRRSTCARSAARDRSASCCPPAIQFKGSGWYITDYAQKVDDATPWQTVGDPALRDKIRQRRQRPKSRRASAKHVRTSDASNTAGDNAEDRLAGRSSWPASADDSTVEIDRLQVLAERLARGPAAAARSTPPPSGTRACCPCRGGRRRSGRRRSAADFSRWRRPLVSWISPVRSLGRRFERREDVGRQDVAADDREVRRRFLARRLLDQVADPVDARPRSASRVDDAVARLTSSRGTALDREHRARPPRSNTSIICFSAGGVRVDHVVAQDDGERLVADEVLRDEHGVAEAERLSLAHVRRR